MYHKVVKVRNKAGIHCRPTSVILLEAQKYPSCHFKIASSSGISNLDSMISLLALGISYGEHVSITVEGDQEDIAGPAIASLFEFEFDFPDPHSV